MNKLREALDQLEKAKQMLSKAIEESLKPTSILDGKFAIQVNNEREFKLLMEHYKSKGFVSEDNESLINCFNAYPYPTIIKYSCTPTHGKVEIDGHKTIQFEDFAKEVGI